MNLSGQYYTRTMSQKCVQLGGWCHDYYALFINWANFLFKLDCWVREYLEYFR